MLEMLERESIDTMSKLRIAEDNFKFAAKAYAKASGEHHDDSNTWQALSRAGLEYAVVWAKENAKTASIGLREVADFLKNIRLPRG